MDTPQQPLQPQRDPVASRAEVDGNLALFKFNTDLVMHIDKATTSVAEEGLKALIAINGGAAVALLAFIGATAASYTPKFSIPILTTALGTFLSGVIVTMVAFLCAYLTNYCYVSSIDLSQWPPTRKAVWYRFGLIFHGLGLLLALWGLWSFIAGTWAAVDAFKPPA